MWSLTGRNGNIPMQLTVNGVPRSWLDPYTGSHDATNTASGFILLRVTSGDKVMIRTHPTFLPKGYIESDTWIQSGFGGWVLGYD
ncbi:hypothetical protein FSP39_008725 [Pinctada imbricata]|uniref:Uncharacterized protein n=1 Tax=Pinctada imbricata TaxID=66713 RepID=A0AA88XQZ8_PINIB|nr:hypothetical protein FSP39_008725 [Pinctada imbricata]